MDDVTRLFGLSFCMLAGCYIAGAIALAFTMSEVRVVNNQVTLCAFGCLCTYFSYDCRLSRYLCSF